MELYFSPLSCSLATRIALYESQQEATFHAVELSTKRLADGTDYCTINRKGQVPALRTDQGELLTEGPAVLQYVADRAPASGLAPSSGTLERTRLHQWLNYLATEIHKVGFHPLFNPSAPDEVKAFALAGIPAQFDFVSQHLEGREFLLAQFSVADAYLVTALGWAAPAGLDLSRWPALDAYRKRLLQRPAVARAVNEEVALWKPV